MKGGISNKSQIHNETNVARPSLWANLKNKAGLQTLSTLFVAVLEKRQACGRLTTPNSFKPPPRLTLRDSTRETWLHDLANPTVGLRRLSRTIPHGITGKVLLDQCLNKNIPLPRAVWLAKCVGINEMRSHQRKGQAGTITWVRGWTSSVEQFLDSTIATMGQQEWKARITYALQLATSLYKDRLLEEEHFLDWILKSLETCPPERLFLWLLVSSLYGQELTASRRRGRRWAESLLTHAERLYQLEEESQMFPLIEYLEKTLAQLLATNSSCLLLPKAWEKHSPVLSRFASRSPHRQITSIVQDLDRRAKRLLHMSRNASSSTTASTRRLLLLLDSIDYRIRVHIEALAEQCMEVVSDARSLISTVLRWASSLYRDGSHRVYIATRLLRRWSQSGTDVDDGLLAYLLSTNAKLGCEPRNVFRIVAELVRSKTFSIGKYLQWLIATGSLNNTQDPSSPSSWPLRLITEIPLTGLPEQVLNLRSTLLRGTKYSNQVEEQSLDNAEAAIRQKLSGLFATAMVEDPPPELSVASLSSTVKLELAVLLRQQVVGTVEIMDRVPTKDPAVEESGPVCMMSSHDFQLVRSYLEEFGDLSILADILQIATMSLDSNVLASAADTLHYNHKAFRAIGAFEPLFGKIAMRYAAIRTVRFPERELLISLTDLSRTARAEGHLMQALAYDLSRHEQKNSVAACSPVSDTMAEVIHNTAIDSDEEIDRILSSGTSMDHQIMLRVFGKIVVNLEEQSSKGSIPSGNHAIWLYRLRSFDENAFEAIVVEWLGSLLTNRQSKLTHSALPPLVTGGCLTLTQFSEIARTSICKRKAISQEEALRSCIAALDVLLPSDRLNHYCPLQEAYRYRLEQQKFCQDPEGHILQLIRDTVEVGSGSLSPASQAQVASLLSSNRVRVVVKHFALHDVQSLSTSLGIGAQTSSEVTHSGLKLLLDGLLDPGNRLGLSGKSTEQQVATVVDAADYLSLPFCQLEIRQLFAASSSDAEDSLNARSAALLEAIKLAVEKDQSPWSDLIAGLESGLTARIREHAERELLNASAFLHGSTAVDPDQLNRHGQSFIEKYLTVIDFTASDTIKEGQATIITALIERFKGLGEALNRLHDPSKQNSTAVQSSSDITYLHSWLNALLRLTVVHGSKPLHRVPNQLQAALLWSLRLLFTHQGLSTSPALAEYVFDVAMLLADNVSDDVRNQLAKLDAAKSLDDPRCRFLFGSTPTRDGWLALAKPIASTAASQPTSSPQQPPQQTNQSPSQQQHVQDQQNHPSGAVPLQRTLSQQQQQQLLSQSQNQSRMHAQYSQHPQANKMLSQLQRVASGAGQNTQQSQLQQMQQMQQMQSLAQQRGTQPSPVQMQRQPMPPSQPSNRTAKSSMAKQEVREMRTVPFALKRWEILPESGGNPAGNETAISLALFGARKV